MSGVIDFAGARELATNFLGSHSAESSAWANLCRAFLWADDRGAELLPPASQLTPRQHEILLFIAESFDTKGWAPSFEEIAARFGYSSLATVHEHLSNLQRKGWIDRDYNTSRSITIRRMPTDTGVAGDVA